MGWIGNHGSGNHKVARDPFLQQELGRGDHGLGMKPSAHQTVQQTIGYGRNRHALVMGHEGADHRNALAGGQAGGGKVQGLVKAIAAPRAQTIKGFEIAAGRLWINHGR